jgi:phosphatidylglycerophosphatase A
MSQPTPNPTTTSNAKRKPRISLAIATAFGLGYFPKAPGTFASLAGIALAVFPSWLQSRVESGGTQFLGVSLPAGPQVEPVILFQIILTVLAALIGVWSADRAGTYWNTKDPQQVVIDEVSGQHLALLLGGFWPRHASPLIASQAARWDNHPLGAGMWVSPNWKYLLLGFILFRVFDIWKPFPARQAESLPGGLGIMADDWVAGIYAALGLWIARALGL